MIPQQYSAITNKARFKTTRIIHLALLAGQVLFAAVVFFLTRSTAISTDTNNPLFVVAPLLAMAAVVASIFLYKQQLALATQQQTLNSKLAQYQTALIIRWALLESASLFNIVCYFVTGNFALLLIAFLIIAYFISIRPTINSAENDLNLTYEEKLDLEG